MRKTGFLFLLVSSILLGSAVAFGQSPNTPRLKTFVTGLSRPVLLRNAHDGSHRIFAVQQTGVIKVFQPGSNTPTDFMDLSSKCVVPVVASDERGLLGMTFHPQFATNGKFYTNCSRKSDGATIVAEYTTVAGNPNQGNLTSERILLIVPQPFTNHNGGMIEFGPDGYLYIGMGDGGSADDPGNRAQNPANLLGKMLRIDPNSTSPPYAIPPTNPFTGAGTGRCDNNVPTAATCQELWTIGMRNPWRWSFDRGGSNQLYVADVGQNLWEELDIITAGANYGWRAWEGTVCNANISGNCPTSVVQTPPYYTYFHTAGRCSVTGGYVYRGALSALPVGAYTFADYCTGEVWIWNNNAAELILDTPRQIVSFGEDEDGELYICYSNGQIDAMVRATAPVSGRVTTPDDRGLRGAVVTLADSSGTRTTTTSSLGFYQFDGVTTGQDCTIKVFSKLYRFTMQTITVDGALSNVNFKGAE